jgi:hypothetical protein
MGDIGFLDGNDEVGLKEAYRQIILPWVEGMTEEGRSTLRISLAFFLRQPERRLLDILASLQDLEMTMPTDARMPFVWLWEVIFPDTNPEDFDLSQCVVDDSFDRMRDLL